MMQADHSHNRLRGPDTLLLSMDAGEGRENTLYRFDQHVTDLFGK